MTSEIIRDNQGFISHVVEKHKTKGGLFTIKINYDFNNEVINIIIELFGIVLVDRVIGMPIKK